MVFKFTLKFSTKCQKIADRTNVSQISKFSPFIFIIIIGHILINKKKTPDKEVEIAYICIWKKVWLPSGGVLPLTVAWKQLQLRKCCRKTQDTKNYTAANLLIALNAADAVRLLVFSNVERG